MNTSGTLLETSPLIPQTSESRLQFAANYNRNDFLIRHSLHQSELFRMPALMHLAQRMSVIPDAVYFNVGRQNIDRGWDFSGHSFSAAEALDRIESSDAWMILRKVQREPAYGEALHEILREVHEASGREYKGVTHSQNLSIILTSPNRVTPYHFDADCNYLLQIHGSKTLYVFNGADRSIVTPEELERFYMGDMNAAQYKPLLQDSAHRYELVPGTGVHVPVTFPHWVQNHSNVSVSASINFSFNDETIPDLHRVNHYLRRAHLNPGQPGKSVLSDRAKGVAAGWLRSIGKLKRPERSSN